ncbi:hypothetical protein D3C80_1014360 [compost metagenome]
MLASLAAAAGSWLPFKSRISRKYNSAVPRTGSEVAELLLPRILILLMLAFSQTELLGRLLGLFSLQA